MVYLLLGGVILTPPKAYTPIAKQHKQETLETLR